MTSFFRFALVVIALIFPGSSIADLPAESARIDESYRQERARGIINLNNRFIANFREEQEAAVKAGELEGALAIRNRINELEAEISQMGEELEETEMRAEEAIPKEVPSLEKKTVWFPHDRQPEKTVGFRFLENGEAFWIGLGGLEVERVYKPLDEKGKFQVWWDERDGAVGYEITLAEDGKTAAVRNLATGYTAQGKVKRSR